MPTDVFAGGGHGEDCDPVSGIEICIVASMIQGIVDIAAATSVQNRVAIYLGPN